MKLFLLKIKEKKHYLIVLLILSGMTSNFSIDPVTSTYDARYDLTKNLAINLTGSINKGFDIDKLDIKFKHDATQDPTFDLTISKESINLNYTINYNLY